MLSENKLEYNDSYKEPLVVNRIDVNINEIITWELFFPKNKNLKNLSKDELIATSVVGLEINIIDKNKKRFSLFVNKRVIASLSDFFSDLIQQNREAESIDLHVKNAHIAYDFFESYDSGKIINSMNYPEWEYKLETYLFKNFIGWKNNEY
jgi:hypothetical protein